VRGNLRISILAFLIFGGLAGTGLLGYELPAQADERLGRRLPGWRSARRAEAVTPWRPCTGWLPCDRMLHEGEEAVLFWRLVLDP
jgi:hypothetical protein